MNICFASWSDGRGEFAVCHGPMNQHISHCRGARRDPHSPTKVRFAKLKPTRERAAHGPFFGGRHYGTQSPIRRFGEIWSTVLKAQ